MSDLNSRARTIAEGMPELRRLAHQLGRLVGATFGNDVGFVVAIWDGTAVAWAASDDKEFEAFVDVAKEELEGAPRPTGEGA